MKKNLMTEKMKEKILADSQIKLLAAFGSLRKLQSEITTIICDIQQAQANLENFEFLTKKKTTD